MAKSASSSKDPGYLEYTIKIGSSEDLGSRKPMIRQLGQRMDRQRRQRMAEWAGDLKKVQTKRRQILENLTYNPPAVPFRPKLLKEERFPAFVRRTYRLQINPDDQTEAVLYLPHHASKKKPVPGLLALHEHGGQLLLGKDKVCRIRNLAPTFQRYQDVCYGGQPPADFFAEQGFAVFCIDQMGFGSRALWLDEDKPYRNLHNVSPEDDLRLRLRMRYEQVFLHRALLTYGLAESDFVLYDSRRALDFFQSIPGVDGNRLGAFGLSIGSMHAHQVAAIDQRIKASVRVCWSGDMTQMLRERGARVLGCQFLLPRLSGEFHVPQWVALSAPNAVLILNGRQDAMYSFADQEAARKEIQRIARLQGRQDSVRWSYFDGPHCFYPPQQQQALEFFHEFLGG